MYPLSNTASLKNKLDSLLVAFGSAGMELLRRLHLRLSSVDQAAGMMLIQLVRLLLCRPVFHVHQLFFKLVYAANNRRINRVRTHF